MRFLLRTILPSPKSRSTSCIVFGLIPRISVCTPIVSFVLICVWGVLNVIAMVFAPIHIVVLATATV
jgi:hypothetical protein